MPGFRTWPGQRTKHNEADLSISGRWNNYYAMSTNVDAAACYPNSSVMLITVGNFFWYGCGIVKIKHRGAATVLLASGRCRWCELNPTYIPSWHRECNLVAYESHYADLVNSSGNNSRATSWASALSRVLYDREWIEADFTLINNNSP